MSALSTIIYDALMKARCAAAAAKRTPSTAELTEAVVAVVEPYIAKQHREAPTA